MDSGSGARHVFTVDVEDYFHSEVPDVEKWSSIPSRVERSTETVLELCAEADVRGTFFVLGWVARRHPGLVRAIVAAGHELASHGSDHEFVYRMTPERFRSDIVRARDVLQDITGVRVQGYRAPYFSIVASTPWAYDVLADAGYTFSSSVFPGRNRRYGIRGHPADPIRRATTGGAAVWEAPITTFHGRIGCGGVYFRALPYPLFAAELAAGERAGRSVVFYIHPWEADPGKPAEGSLELRLRHGIGIRATVPRLRRMFKSFAFGPLGPRLGVIPESLTPEMVH